jgi:hypothetical protein
MRKLLSFRRAPAAARPIASDTALLGLARLHLGGPGAGISRAAPIGSDPYPHSFGQGRQNWACICIPTPQQLRLFISEGFEMNQVKRKKKPGIGAGR